MQTIEELSEALRYAQRENLSWVVIGGGSNMLASDDGYDGLVIKMCIKGRTVISEDDERVMVRAAAGESWDAFVVWSVERGYWGIENLSGIPGTVGATPIQNVGAYGVEVADVIDHVAVLNTQTGVIEQMDGAACRFGYRDSIFKHNDGKHLVVVSVSFNLLKKGVPNILYKDLANYFVECPLDSLSLKDIRVAVISIRSQKFPDIQRVGTAGSFFKNPIISEAYATRLREGFPSIPLYEYGSMYKTSAAWILDKACNLKGYSEGGVVLFEHQPLVLVAYGGTTATDIDMFASVIEKRVFDATGIKLEREVRKLCNKK